MEDRQPENTKTVSLGKIGGVASTILLCLATTGLPVALPAAEGVATPLFTDDS